MIAKTEMVEGKQIEVHEKRFSSQPYWVKIDGQALLQKGRMRVRTFNTVGAAWNVALKEIKAC